ncbi:hypothetical protein CCP2SC5_440010 [Azospirillaceae bacterium]
MRASPCVAEHLRRIVFYFYFVVFLPYQAPPSNGYIAGQRLNGHMKLPIS